MDCALLYATIFDWLDKGFLQSKNLVDFNQNIIMKLGNNIKKTLQEHPLPSYEKDSQEYIRKAIADFYRKNGMSSFVYFDKNKNIKVSASIKNPVDNLCVSFLARWVIENKDSFDCNNFDGENNIFSQQDLARIFEYAKVCSDCDDDLVLRDVARNAIKKTFDFNFRDGLFFSKSGIHIKAFDFEFVQTNNEIRSISKLSSEKLLDENEREKIKTFFKGVNLDKLVLESVDYVLDNKIDLNVISNVEFAKNFLFFIVQSFRLNLNKFLDNKVSGTLQTCFAEERIRTSKNIIFERVAKRLLQLIYEGHTGAKNFVKFYRGQSLIIDSKEIIVPAIVDSNGIVWDLKRVEQVLPQRYQLELSVDDAKKHQSEINSVILETSATIEEYQNKISEKNKILTKIDLDYENSKKQLKDLKENDTIQKETLSLDLGKQLEGKRTVLNEIENITEQIETLKHKRVRCIQDQKRLQESIDKVYGDNQRQLMQSNMLIEALSNAISRVSIEH